MTREEVYNELREIINRECHKDHDYMTYSRMIDLLDDLNELVIDVKNPWVRTADRRPTPKDADAWDLVFATHRAFGGEPYKVCYQVVANNPSDHVWWMPIPPLPEVDHVNS